MIDKVPSLMRLCKQLQNVPYLASKNLYKVATYILTEPLPRIEQLCTTLLEAKKNITQCTICCVWKERAADCVFCSDLRRDASVVCVVESWYELIAIEKTEGYKGLYHVLGGVISPLDGVGPEDLTVAILVERLKNNSQIKEIILATNQTPESEATASYVVKKIEAFSLTITCLARGIPVGSSLDTIDKLTVYKALSERRPF